MEYIKQANRQSLSEKAFSCTGRADTAVRFITSEQLKDRALWHSLIAQFSRRPDTWQWRGEFFGKLMRGGCYVYRCTRDAELYEILTDAMKELLNRADENGAITAYQSGFEFTGWDIWCRKYVMLGQLYFLEICNDGELYEKALSSACRQADCLMTHVGQGKTDILDTSEIWGGMNSSSVLEPIVKLYELTGKPEYLQYAEYIYSRGGSRDINIFQAALTGIPPYKYPVKKAYEMMSNFEGVLELYRATGKEEYKNAAVAFADMISETEITLTGGCGTNEEQFDHGVVNQFNPERRGIMLETCVTVTWMKLCFRLLLLTGNGKYADEIEKSANNALYGALNYNHRKAQGWIFPTDSYSPSYNSCRGRIVGGQQMIEENQLFGCCVAIVAAGIAIPPLACVTEDSEGLCCNLYIPGEISCKSGKLLTETDYPADGRVKITIHGDIGNTAISLRVPAFDKNMKVSVNGIPTDVKTNGKSYKTLRREWRDGDEITLDIDVSPRVVTSSQLGGDGGAFAVRAGALTLCRDSYKEGGALDTPVKPVETDGKYVFEKAASDATAAAACYTLITEQGKIPLYDYASCGLTWDEKYPISVWIRKKFE